MVLTSCLAFRMQYNSWTFYILFLNTLNELYTQHSSKETWRIRYKILQLYALGCHVYYTSKNMSDITIIYDLKSVWN